MRIVTELHSTCYDMKTDIQFNSVLDRRTGCFVGIAVVSDEKAAEFEGRIGFRVLSDEEFLAMTQAPKATEPTEPITGDPLGDQAVTDAPPAPPSGEAKAPKKKADDAPPAPPSGE